MTRPIQLRLTVLSEDERTEQFVRRVLKRRGCNGRRLVFATAPSGNGSAEAWVRRRYVEEVRVHRQKRNQRHRGLVATIDGDHLGLTARKQSFDEALADAGLAPRGADERIALMVPCWSIETWLLGLLAVADVDEGKSLKQTFERRGRSRRDVREAAARWGTAHGLSLSSLLDAEQELERVFV